MSDMITEGLVDDALPPFSGKEQIYGKKGRNPGSAYERYECVRHGSFS